MVRTCEQRHGAGRAVTRRGMLEIGLGGAAAVGTLGGVVLAACGAGAGSGGSTAPTGPVTLEVWGGGDAMAGYVKEYEARTPDTHLTFAPVGDYTMLAEKALTAVSAGTPPNVAVLGQRFGICQLADGNALVSFDNLLSKQARADFYPQYIEKFTYKSQLVALPFQSSVAVLYWNKGQFRTAGLDPEKPPTTWDETVEAGRRLTRAEPSTGSTNWGFMLSSYAWYFYALVWQNGGEVVDKQGEPRFQEAAGVDAARWWKDLVHKHSITPSKRPNTVKDFVGGSGGMLQGSQNIRAQLDRDPIFEYGITFLPKRAKYACSIGGSALGIFKAAGGTGATPERASWRLVDWLTGTDMGARTVEETGYLPLRRSTSQTERMKTFFRAHRYADVPINQLQYLQPQPIQRVDDVMYQALEKALTALDQDASADPRAQLDAVAAQVRQQLAR